MNKTIRSIRFGAALAACSVTFCAWAQTVETPPVPEVGDKWTYRFHNKGDKREPFAYVNEVKTVDGGSAWIYGESQEVNAQLPRYVWRYDIKRAENVERFDFDAAAANGAGKRLINRENVDSWLQFPLTVGKPYKVKRNWDNGQGFDEYTADVEAFEKVKVEAGEFDAYRIKFSGFWNRRSGGSFSGRSEVVIWYAPTVKASVKIRYNNRQSNGQAWNDTSTDLVKWEPAPAK